MSKPLADPLTGASLLLAGHGSSRPGGDNPIQWHRRTIAAAGIFSDVFEGYLKQAPFLGDVLGDIVADNLYVVPMLTGHGYITDELIPGALSKLTDTARVHLCEPIGCHPGIAELLAGQVRAVIAANALDGADVSALLAAHGNRNNPRNAHQAKALAAVIADRCGGVTVEAAFIEEAPLISDWCAATQAGNLIVLPFLIGGGLHGAVDVPEMLGLDPAHPALEALGADTTHAGPFTVHGRSLWYCRAFGHDPALSDMIIDLVKATP